MVLDTWADIGTSLRAIPPFALAGNDEAMQATMSDLRDTLDVQAEHLRKSGMGKEHMAEWQCVVMETSQTRLAAFDHI
ncbi:hypothetical protein DC522_26995 [Microvirga sp. KLBC 81]|nr:hypothetical protein DC522_26995 [Microvirga sp. KLBC 81]